MYVCVLCVYIYMVCLHVCICYSACIYVMCGIYVYLCDMCVAYECVHGMYMILYLYTVCV